MQTRFISRGFDKSRRMITAISLVTLLGAASITLFSERVFASDGLGEGDELANEMKNLKLAGDSMKNSGQDDASQAAEQKTSINGMVQVEPSAQKIMPGLKVFYGVLRGADNSGSNAESVRATQEVFSRECEDGKKRWSPIEPSKIPEIAAWGKRFKQFPNPKKSVASIDSLIRRVRSGKYPPSISPFVDLYNAMSIKYGVPMGGEDLKKMTPLKTSTMVVKAADGTEPYKGLGADAPDEFPLPQELIYADGGGTICRALNWRESARTCIDKTTTDAVFVIEAIGDEESARAKAAMDELGKLLVSNCGGNFEVSTAE